jgi:murein hydrolase activator
MMRVTFLLAFIFTISYVASAQQTREELERQKKELNKELAESQKLLNNVNAETKSSLTTYTMFENRAQIQNKLVGNITKDINILDNNIVGIQRDVNKYDKLLDTLQQEYAKSMVYAYKNRGNYEFLNFIFSADNFNDAIKRIAYLKSYRTYREMQGQNIIRTQDLRRKRLDDLGATKQVKSTVLVSQTDEMKKLAEQKQKQANIVAQLKKQGQDLNATIAARQRQIVKINAAVKEAIAKALREERAKEKERKRLADIALKKKRAEQQAEADRQEKIRRDEESRLAKIAKAAGKEPVKPADPIKVTTKVIKEPKEPKVPEQLDLSPESGRLNAGLEQNKGILPWPVDNPAILNHYGPNKFESGASFMNDGVTIAAPVGASVKSVFQGTVILLTSIDDGKYLVIVKNGSYFFSYVNLTNVSVSLNSEVKTGQVLGRVGANIDGIGAIDFKATKGERDLNPEQWLRRR